MKSPHSFTASFLIIVFITGLSKVEVFNALQAQPAQVHLSLTAKRTPESSSSVIVTWCSEKSQGNQFVKYGPTPETINILKAKKDDFNNKLVLNAKIKKLKRGTKYFYRCGSEETGWSPLYFFNTEPDSGRFRVGIIGDTQNNTNNEKFQKTKEIADLVQIYSPSVTLHMGDMVDNGSVTSNWTDFLSATQELNTVSPLMPVLGNHDVENKTGKDFQKPYEDYHSLFNLPGDEVNYFFTYMNVRFIGIYSGCAQAAEGMGQVKYKPGSPEYKWLDSELAKAGKDARIRWVIVWMHYPVYSFGWSNITKWRENLLPLLAKHRVDLCLAGHRHVYERHYQMKDGVPVKNNSGTAFSAGKGTVFVTNGTAGGNPTGLGGKDLPTMAFTPDRIMYSFGIMDISNRSITYRVFDRDNLLIDWFTITR